MRYVVLNVTYCKMVASGEIKVFMGQSQASSRHQGSLSLPQQQVRYVGKGRFLQPVQVVVENSRGWSGAAVPQDLVAAAV